MSVEYFDPEGLQKPHGYRHAAAATVQTFAYCAGQVSTDAQGQVVGAGDYTAQAHQAMLNVMTALKSAGASGQSILKLTVYVVGIESIEAQKEIYRGFAQAGKETPIVAAPSTMIGVAALMNEDLLLEIDAVAVAD